MAIDKFKRVDITLDKANKYIIGDQLAKVGDIQGRDLVVQITNAGVVQSQPDIKLMLSWHNKNVGNSGMTDFKALDRSQGVFIVTFPDEMNNAGNVVATIGVNEADKWTFSRNFIIKVEENSFTASAPLESDDWATLLAAIYNANHITEIVQEQLNEFYEMSKQEWQEFVDANKNIISAIDPGGVLLNEIITARNDGETTYGTLGERLNQTYPINTDFLSNGEPEQRFTGKIADTLLKVNGSNFNLVVNTDGHYQDRSDYGNFQNYPGVAKHSMEHYTNLLALGAKADAVIMGGDNIHPDYKNIEVGKKDMQVVSQKIINNKDGADRFMILGNHDVGDSVILFNSSGKAKLSEVISEEEVKKFYQTSDKVFGETRNGDSLYFYKDYPNKKIRLIGLVTEDTGEQLDGNGYLKYTRLLTHALRQEQLEWVANTALQNIPADTHVMIFGHAPMHNNTVGDERDKFYNFDILAGIISAFKTGSKYVGGSSITDFNANVTADFTAQGAREFVGYFCGHYHMEWLGEFLGVKQAILLNSVCSKDQGSVDRILNSDTEDAQTIVSVDTVNKKVDLIGFGAASDRSYNY